jgi:hypothetical protein
MHRVRALGLDNATTQQLFEIFDRVMSEFVAVRRSTVRTKVYATSSLWPCSTCCKTVSAICK